MIGRVDLASERLLTADKAARQARAMEIAEDAAREELERLRPRSARDLVRPVLEPSR